jgi:hypothetical protein
VLDDEVQEALRICGGDALAALRITLIANALLGGVCRHLLRAMHRSRSCITRGLEFGQAVARLAHSVLLAGMDHHPFAQGKRVQI